MQRIAIGITTSACQFIFQIVKVGDARLPIKSFLTPGRPFSFARHHGPKEKIGESLRRVSNYFEAAGMLLDGYHDGHLIQPGRVMEFLTAINALFIEPR